METIFFKPNELKIYYRGEVNRELDAELGKVLKKFGYSQWASGMEIETSLRDLCFEKKDK